MRRARTGELTRSRVRREGREERARAADRRRRRRRERGTAFAARSPPSASLFQAVQLDLQLDSFSRAASPSSSPSHSASTAAGLLSPSPPRHSIFRLRSPLPRPLHLSPPRHPSAATRIKLRGLSLGPQPSGDKLAAASSTRGIATPTRSLEPCSRHLLRSMNAARYRDTLHSLEAKSGQTTGPGSTCATRSSSSASRSAVEAVPSAFREPRGERGGRTCRARSVGRGRARRGCSRRGRRTRRRAR